MSAISIEPTYPIFTDSDGSPLDDGFVWIGTAGASNPPASPQTAYWDAALTQVVTQPVRTRGGYPLNVVAIGRLYVAGDYSILVRNRNGYDLYSAPNVTERISGVVTTIDASNVTFTQAGANAAQRTALAKMRDFVSVADFASVQDALNYCNTNDKALYWDKDYTVSVALTGLHTVKHFGNGALTRGSDTFYPAIREGLTNTLYAAPSGTGDGITSAAPMTLANAVAALENYGPMLDGSWIVRCAAGTYPGGVQVGRNLESRDFIKILGPTAGHPNVPTAIIDKAADVSKTYGIFASDGVLIWVQDIKIIGAFAQAEYMTRNVYYQRRNVHVDGADTGLQINTQSRYFVYGGKIENCTDAGINELFHITRSFDTVASAADQLTISNCQIGLKAKENCIGHTDYLNFEDCETGMELQLFSGTNPKGSTYKRCATGIVLVNSELHNETAIVWGTGADACTQRIISLGSSSEISSFGWVPNTSGPMTVRTGHRPQVLYASDYTTASVTGTTTETDVASFAAILPAGEYSVQGKKYRVLVQGRIPSGTTLAADARILLRVGGTFMTDVTVPSGTVGSAPFRVEFDVTCTSDGSNQRAVGFMVGTGFTSTTNAARTVDMSSVDRGVAVSVILGNAADDIDIETVELFA